jgi:hypothetical protein
MAKVPPLREFRKPNTFGAIPKNIEREIEPKFDFIDPLNSGEDRVNIKLDSVNNVESISNPASPVVVGL